MAVGIAVRSRCRIKGPGNTPGISGPEFKTVPDGKTAEKDFVLIDLHNHDFFRPFGAGGGTDEDARPVKETACIDSCEIALPDIPFVPESSVAVSRNADDLGEFISQTADPSAAPQTAGGCGSRNFVF